MTFEMNQHNLKNIGKIAVVLLIIYLIAHHFLKSSGPVIPLPKVVIQKPVEAEITEYVTQTGTLVAFNSVDLVARIEGFLNEIKFTDGTFVKKGQELFVFNPNLTLKN